MSRLFARTRSAKRRRDTPPPIPTMIGGALVLLGLLVLGWQALSVYNGVPGRAYATYYVSTPEVGNLLNHDQVRIAGARVGQVVDRDIGPDGRPRLELQIEPNTQLSSDTRVAVRAAGLLGARFIELLPGRSTTGLAGGATIRGDDGSYAYGLPEFLDTFDQPTRAALGSMVGGFGQGMLGHGERVNDAIHVVGTRAKPFEEFAVAVLRREGAARRLIPALESAMRPLDINRKPLAKLNGVAADAAEPFIAGREAIRRTLDEAPPALAAVTPGLTAGTRLLGSVRELAAEVDGTLPAAPGGLRALESLMRDSRGPLERTSVLLRKVRPAAPAALGITKALSPVNRPLQELLADLSPTLGHIGRYSCDVKNFAITVRSMTGFRQVGQGPFGEAMGFRLQVMAPLSTETVGAKDRLGLNKRSGVTPPCTFLSEPYEQAPGGSR